MLKHYFLVIFRNFRRYKSTFLINLIGLSAGLACVLLIYMWVNDELSFDKFHETDDQLYQVMANHNNSDKIVTLENTPDLLAETLAEEIPEVEYAAAVNPANVLGNFSLSVNNKIIKAEGQFAGKDYFKMFSYKIIRGNKAKLLTNKNSIVITKQLAEKLFNTTKNVIGRTFEWQWQNIKNEVEVSGIIQSPPLNSSTQFDFILPFEVWKDVSNQLNRPINWDNHGPYTYVVLKKGTDANQFDVKIVNFIKSKYENSKVTLFARKYSDKYLYGSYENGVQAGGRIEYVKIFSAVAVFILLIACINFMNMSTAKAASRLKEVGIKKTIGAKRKNLVLQYIGESTALAFLSLLAAVIFTEMFLPIFNEITGKHISFNYNFNLTLFFIGIVLFTGFLAGSYPALYLSRFNPINILKGNIRVSSGEFWIRRGLVVFQFSLSLILIICLLVVNEQIGYIETRNPGYKKENIIYFDKEGKAAKNTESFLAEIKKIHGVVNASITGSTVIGSQNSTGGVFWSGKQPDEVIYFEEIYAGYELLDVLGVEMKEGRKFSKDFGAEKSKILFNEAAIKAMGLEGPAVGQTVRHYTGEKEIIGVVRDFNFESLHEPVKPLLFRIAPEYTFKFMVKIEAGKEKEIIKNLKEFYSKYNPGYTFNFKFLDADYQQQYISEKRVETLSKYFTSLAIIISCMGLFGLAVYTAVKRRKEVGIRKVLGARTDSIVILLSKEFLNLVVISFLISSPVAYYIVNSWLEDFAYRIEVGWWMFALSGGIALGIALATVSFQVIKAATANPVESLKYE